MPLPRPRFTIHHMLLAVAVVAICAGGIRQDGADAVLWETPAVVALLMARPTRGLKNLGVTMMAGAFAGAATFCVLSEFHTRASAIPILARSSLMLDLLIGFVVGLLCGFLAWAIAFHAVALKQMLSPGFWSDPRSRLVFADPDQPKPE